MKTVFLVLATVITIASVIPYLRDILRGNTKPNLVSWITWTLLTGIATAAEIAAGEYVTAVFTGVAAMATLSIVLFGLHHGFVRYSLFDVTCQIAAIAGILLWQLFDSPTIGVLASVIIDFVGALPTFRHIWLKPNEETWQTFAIAAVAAIFALFSLHTYNWVSLPYAVYLLVVNGFMAALIVERRKKA